MAEEMTSSNLGPHNLGEMTEGELVHVTCNMQLSLNDFWINNIFLISTYFWREVRVGGEK